MGNIETTIYRLKSISGIEDNYSFTSVNYLFSGVSLQLQKKLSSFIVKKMFVEIGIEKVFKEVFKEFLKGFFKFVFGFFYNYKEKLDVLWWRKCSLK